MGEVLSILMLMHESPGTAVAFVLVEDQAMPSLMAMKVESMVIDAVRMMVAVKKETRLEMVLLLGPTPAALDHPS